MDPTHNTSPDESALPNVPPQFPPIGGAPAGSFGMPVAGGGVAGPEVAPAPGGAVSSAPPADSWLPPTVPVQPSGTGRGQTGGAPTAGAPGLHVPTPQVADDGDVIEKEWVEKAKHIVAQTRQDPYRQTKELHKFKAEYMQKRYNKTIEAVDE
jgi:hypothetical protein